jgi:hypothetical protein
MLSSQITDELKLVAHPVGISIYVLRENSGEEHIFYWSS